MPSFNPVPAKPDHVALEHRILERWDTERTFEQLRDQNRGNEPWSFIDGPITANNPMGVHHAWGRTLKDVFQRFHAAQGRDQRYQNGFDCQGLWVEVGVEKQLGLNSKRDIETFGLDRFARACRDRVAEYSAVQTQQSKRLGQWMDWERSYFTMTDVNISYIWTFLAECHQRGWLYLGHRSMPWCPRCGTSLSQHELIDSYEDLTHPSLYVRFPLLERENEALVAWTTTPWTLPANTAAAVHPDETYVRVRVGDDILIVAEARLDALALGGDVLDRVLGSDLVGLRYRGPFEDLDAQAEIEPRVVGWTDVSMEDGTGIVHIAPGCGAEDFELGKREGLPALVPIDEAGRFVAGHGEFSGLETSEARAQLIADLESRGRLHQAGEITHRYPVCWRCKTELVYRLVDEWFIRSEDIREPMIEAARTVVWQPEQYGKRMEDWLRNMGDWCISRKRYWGLPLPFWFCPDGHMTLVSSEDDLRTRATAGLDGLEELHRPWIDEVTLDCDTCGQTATRITDVGDCWLDAGIVPFATMGWRNDTRVDGGYAKGAGEGLTVADLPSHDEWQRWFPADWISEMREQIRLWFYSMLFMSVVLEGRSPYRRVLSYERVHAEDGRAMHKSSGNMIEANEALDTMGADVMRWMYCAQNPASNLNFGYQPATDVKRKLLTQWNCYRFLIDYAMIEGWTPNAGLLDGPTAPVRALDRWLVARTRSLVADVTHALSDFDTQAAVREIESFTDDLSNWYLRLSRNRFWKSDDPSDQIAAFESLWHALVTLQRVQAPLMPFLAEDLWETLAAPFGMPTSVHLAGWPIEVPDAADVALLGEMRIVRTVVDLGRSARADAKIKTRQPIATMTVATGNEAARAALLEHAALIRAELAVKDLVVVESAEAFATIEVVPNFKVLGPKLGADLPKIVAKVKAGEAVLDGDSVRVGDVILGPGEFETRTRAKEGLAVVDDDGFVVALDTQLTSELLLEGEARELIRSIQELRKQAELALTDRIRVRYAASAASCVEAFGDRIAAEVLAEDLQPGDALEIEKT